MNEPTTVIHVGEVHIYLAEPDHEERIVDLEVGAAQLEADHNTVSRLLRELADVIGR